MPLSLTVSERKLGVREFVVRFVMLLGTGTNMDGTALYPGVAALFLAQVFGVEIGFSGMLLTIITATSINVTSDISTTVVVDRVLPSAAATPTTA